MSMSVVDDNKILMLCYWAVKSFLPSQFSKAIIETYYKASVGVETASVLQESPLLHA